MLIYLKLYKHLKFRSLEKNFFHRASCEDLLTKLEEENLRQKVLSISTCGTNTNVIHFDYAIERVLFYFIFIFGT